MKGVELIDVPSPVIAEWWRGVPAKPTSKNASVPRVCRWSPTSFHLARVAGEAMARTGATVVDAIVMASAAQRGDVVYTSDVEDLERLRAYFPEVRVFAV